MLISKERPSPVDSYLSSISDVERSHDAHSLTVPIKEMQRLGIVKKISAT